MVMAVTAALACSAAGCGAASAYKFSCDKRVCEVETSGPVKLDFQKEYGTTVEVIETTDERVTMQAGSARATFGRLESGTLGPVKVTVRNIKGEAAFFTLRP